MLPDAGDPKDSNDKSVQANYNCLKARVSGVIWISTRGTVHADIKASLLGEENMRTGLSRLVTGHVPVLSWRQPYTHPVVRQRIPTETRHVTVVQQGQSGNISATAVEAPWHLSSG
jgi:hypothetical protein